MLNEWHMHFITNNPSMSFFSSDEGVVCSSTAFAPSAPNPIIFCLYGMCLSLNKVTTKLYASQGNQSKEAIFDLVIPPLVSAPPYMCVTHPFVTILITTTETLTVLQLCFKHSRTMVSSHIIITVTLVRPRSTSLLLCLNLDTLLS